MIILSSYGFRSPIVSQKMKQYITCPENKKVLIIPFAGFNSENTGVREKNGLIDFGFSSSNIFILNLDNVSEIESLKFDYIYVPGGDPFKLLSELQMLNFMPYIISSIESGCTYLGVSAGAMLATTNIEYVTNLEDNNYSLSSFDGLGLINDCVVCHIDQYDYSTIIRCKNTVGDRHMLGVRNDDVIALEACND